MQISLKSIGIIHSPFTELSGMPIQPTSESNAPGHVELYPDYVEGLSDLDGFSHIYLLYLLHKVQKTKLTVTPFLDTQPHGVFATRAPNRPNPIGLSLVKLVRIEGNLLYLDKIDILDGTPLLDIKPYIPGFEDTRDIRTGWLENARHSVQEARSDRRFLDKS